MSDAGKVQIPSIADTSAPAHASKHRTAHACDRCRQMRVKCSGGQPCKKCLKDDKLCVYGDRRRERNKKDLAESRNRVKDLEEEIDKWTAFLEKLTSNAGLSDLEKHEIRDLITKSRNSRFSPDKPEGQPEGQPEFDDGDEGETEATSAIGSPGRQQELLAAVDPDQGSGASGFVGKRSEMAWMQRAREYLQGQPGSLSVATHARHDQHTASDQNITYFMDDIDLLLVDEDHVDPLYCPPYQIAVILCEAYFHAAHSAFRFVMRERLLATIRANAGRLSSLTWNDRRWLAVANIVWAIGLKWLNLVNLDQQITDHHLVYYARARALGLDHRVVIDHPDIDMVEGIGILAFYLFMNGSVSRSRNLLGHAIRHATTLGLHLKVSDDAMISQSDQERRATLWYSIYNLEILIAETTGRPQAIHLKSMSIEMDTLERHSLTSTHPDDDKAQSDSISVWLRYVSSANNMAGNALGESLSPTDIFAPSRSLSLLYFGHHCRLCGISDQIAMTLYTMSLDDAWSDVQRGISEMALLLDEWKTNVPDDLKLTRSESSLGDARATVGLWMYYYSVSMMLYRPCLCDIKIEHESQRSKEFNNSSGRRCVEAALEMLKLTPDNPIAHQVLQALPWWTLLHYICQAASVLLLELCLDCRHFEHEKNGVLGITSGMQKCMSYLWCLAQNSLSAYRAWRIFRHLCHQVSTQYEGVDILKYPGYAPRPAIWSDDEERSLAAALA